MTKMDKGSMIIGRVTNTKTMRKRSLLGDLTFSMRVMTLILSCLVIMDQPFFLFQWDRALPEIICDNSKEMVQEEFRRMLKKASCHLQHIGSFTPWSNTA